MLLKSEFYELCRAVAALTTGKRIDTALQDMGIEADRTPEQTKAQFLAAVFMGQQWRFPDFVSAAVDVSLFLAADNRAQTETMQRLLGRLGFRYSDFDEAVLPLDADTAQTGKTLNRVILELQRRNVPSALMQYVKPELFNPATAVEALFEAVKAVQEAVRRKLAEKGGNVERLDGDALIRAAFTGKSPALRLYFRNGEEYPLAEQQGFTEIFQGVIKLVRNPLAHKPALYWVKDEAEVMDFFTLLGWLWRRVDECR